MKFSPFIILSAGALSMAVPTVAQASAAAPGTTAVPMTVDDDDDRDFPWGLLGLLGLAGLLGRKRDDRRNDDNIRR